MKKRKNKLKRMLQLLALNIPLLHMCYAEDVIVSNLDGSRAVTTGISPVGSFSINPIAFEFEGLTEEYLLTSITLPLADHPADSVNGAPKVSIYANKNIGLDLVDSEGHLITLNSPVGEIDHEDFRNYVFTPPEPFILEPATKYWVVIADDDFVFGEGTPSGSGTYSVRNVANIPTGVGSSNGWYHWYISTLRSFQPLNAGYRIEAEVRGEPLDGTTTEVTVEDDILIIYPSSVVGGSNEIYHQMSLSEELGIQYIAEYLEGFYREADEDSNIRVDIALADAACLADIAYMPSLNSIRTEIAKGYKYVVLAESPYGASLPSVCYDGVKGLTNLVLEAGSTPLLLMYQHDGLDADTFGEYIYRAANGNGVEVIPAGYALEEVGLLKNQFYATLNEAKQSWTTAASIYYSLTGLSAADSGYTPSYQRYTFPASHQHNFSANVIDQLTAPANEAVDRHYSIEHYHTSFENEGDVIYRHIDLSQEPFNNELRYYWRGTSTQSNTNDSLRNLITGTYSPISTQFGRGRLANGNTLWRATDTAQRAGTLSNDANFGKGLFLYAIESQSNPDAFAQDLKDHNGEQLIPMVFNWIKGFEPTSGIASTNIALNVESAATLWQDFEARGWKTIPLTVGMRRLSAAIPDFIVSNDGLHISDPLVYMNASMMLASSLGQKISVPSNLPIRRGNWTQDELELAIEMGHDIVKELAYLSETHSFIPDNDLFITTDILPSLTSGVSYDYQLTVLGGSGDYKWELISEAGLPDGISLSSDGTLSGVAQQIGSWNVAFKVTDSSGAFRKVGLKLNVNELVILAGYDFDDGSGNPTTAPTVSDASVTASAYTTGAGLNSVISNNANALSEALSAEGDIFGTSNPLSFGSARSHFGFTDMNNKSNLSLAIHNNDYMTFTVTPNVGSQIDLARLSFRTRANNVNNAAERWVLYSSLDGYQIGSGIASGRTTNTRTWNGLTNNIVIDLLDDRYSNLSQPITFRLYIYGGNRLSNSATLFDKVLLHGSANSAIAPVAYWDFDDGQGTVAADYSGRGFDGIVSNGVWSEGVLDFNGIDSTVEIPAEAFDTISDQISISMWVYGDETQARRDAIFHAENALGQRVLNIHLPWSNSKVYWDAGRSSSGIDRIFNPADPETFKGAWNHWVFTKNATSGEMSIYVNGTLFHSEQGKINQILDITAAAIGSGLDRNFYDGSIDNVAIFDTALSAEEVEQLFKATVSE